MALGLSTNVSRSFAHTPERPFAADEELRQVEESPREPIGQAKEIVSAAVLADRRSLRVDEVRMRLRHHQDIARGPAPTSGGAPATGSSSGIGSCLDPGCRR